MEFFTNIDAHFYIAIAISIANATLLCFVGYKFLQIIQLSDYKMSGYFDWIKDTKANYINRVLSLSALSIAGVLVTNAVFDAYTSNKYLSYLGLIFYFYFCVVFIKNLYDAPKKKPLKNTRRMNRLTVCVFVLVTVVTFGIVALSTEYLTLLRFGIVVVTPLLLILIIPIAYYITYPIEQTIKNYYIIKAKKTLQKMPDLIKIGITGSYGKTSCKYMLNTMLSNKYSVCMSPYSFNTPMGLTKVVNNYLEPYNEVLIAEMGATNVNDIKYLCSFIEPKYGILTAVSKQHLSSFKTVENIKKTKYELVECVASKNGFMVFNGENAGSLELYEKATCDKTFTSLTDEKANVYVRNISLSSIGTTFTLFANGESRECKTNLVGKHNIEDIIMCVSLALKLGVLLDDIVKSISELHAIPHRLEILRKGSMTVLDDTFNASIEGSKCALETLSLFKGRKVIFTPGLIELGSDEKQANIDFGKNIASVCDIAVIINKVNSESLKEGMLAGGMKEESILFTETMKHATVMMKDVLGSDDIVLFENDLPDNYT